jgi:hypothetical protein
MNNDSREAFQQWFDSYKDPNVGTVETSIQFRAAWASWQAAQSRHAAEREALVRKCLEARNKVKSMLHDYYNEGYIPDEISELEELLALLNSDTQDVLENSGSQG